MDGAGYSGNDQHHHFAETIKTQPELDLKIAD